MKAHVTHTKDGRIVSVGLGSSLVPEGDAAGVDVELPDGFPSLSGPDAERAVAEAVARLRVGPGGTVT
jgi:hypothetical protein